MDRGRNFLSGKKLQPGAGIVQFCLIKQREVDDIFLYCEFERGKEWLVFLFQKNGRTDETKDYERLWGVAENSP